MSSVTDEEYDIGDSEDFSHMNVSTELRKLRFSGETFLKVTK